MSQKSVSDLILDKLAERLEQDELFKGISSNISSLMRGKKNIKTNLHPLLRKKPNEDSKSGN